MNTISDRIARLVEHFEKGNRTAFANRIGTSEANIRNYIQGRQPKFEILQAIAETLNINTDWLISGRGEMLLSDQAKPYQAKAIMNVPVVNQFAYAGYLNGFSDMEYIKDLPTMPFMADHEAKGDYLCFEIKGESMDDGSSDAYLEGDIVLCRQVDKKHWTSKLHINRWDFILVHREKGILVKRIINHDVEKGIITIHSLNEYYPDQDLKLSEIAQIFNIVDVRRKKRR